MSHEQFTPAPAVESPRASGTPPAVDVAWPPGYELCYVCMFEATLLPDVEPVPAVTTANGTAVCAAHVSAIANSQFFGLAYIGELNRRIDEQRRRQ